MVIWTNKSETAVLLGVQKTEHKLIYRVKISIVYTETPSVLSLFELSLQGVQTYIGTFTFLNKVDAAKYRTYHNLHIKQLTT
jgi:hypothetical protein